MESDCSGNYERLVRFQDTDAAGVVFFANVLTICHEAYEYSIGQVGFDLKLFFSNSGDYAVPIVQAQIDFFKPMFCGDRLLVNLKPQQFDSHSFEISYKITNQYSKLVSIAKTKHTCISLVSDRSKIDIPTEIKEWIKILNPSEIS